MDRQMNDRVVPIRKPPPESKLVSLFNRMLHQRIEGITVDSEEVILVLEDGTNVTFWSDEDLNITYILPEMDD
jgi:hypothetical protein